jgi:hypothetical protein
LVAEQFEWYWIRIAAAESIQLTRLEFERFGARLKRNRPRPVFE